MSTSDDRAHRLGKRELGPYAYEEQMPLRILERLKSDGQTNVISNIIPKLERLLESSSDIDTACLCREDTVLVHKLASEGNTFCGYRNIQMLLQIVAHSKHDPVSKSFHTILDIQEMIEHAWNEGFNADGRLQTGGVKQTRKHIGTPEAEALLQSLGIKCTGNVFNQKHASQELFEFCEAFFGLDHSRTVRVTDKMPIFLQRPKHSVLVVGIARLVDSTRLLVILDPALPPSLSVRRQWESKVLRKVFQKIELATYCRSEKAMSKYAAFETLSVD